MDSQASTTKILQGESSSEVMLFVMIMVMVCPPNRIEEAFELIRLEVANMSPAVTAFAEEYLNYIRATYMNGNYGTATEGFEWNMTTSSKGF